MLDQSVELDKVFHALADPSRRSMLDRLCEGPASVSELARPFDMSLAAVVQHVQVLERSGLVTSEKKGRTRTCMLNPEPMRTAQWWISERRALWERRLDQLGEYLSQHAHDPRSGPQPDNDEPDDDKEQTP